ncbi:Serine protease htra2, mitochondrial [Geranomyces variabilis]|nr:Serine protease htra2, mitochondrial [Geranomyces variabilis]
MAALNLRYSCEQIGRIGHPLLSEHLLGHHGILEGQRHWLAPGQHWHWQVVIEPSKPRRVDDEVLEGEHFTSSNPLSKLKKAIHPGHNNTFIADAVEKAMGAVVNISIETETSSLMREKTLVTSGSGFFIDANGSILTNAHVVTDMASGSTLTVTTTDGVHHEGFIHSLDTLSDLAVVKIKPRPGDAPKGWPVLKMSSNISLRTGDWVVAIGSPFGLHNTVTAGVVSSARRRQDELGPGRSAADVRVEYIQTDCVVHEGSSGGPLINLDGEVVGINTTRADSEGISFAIRADNAMDLVHQLHTQGRVVRPWLGCRMVSLTSQVRQQIRDQGPMTKSIPRSASGGVIVTAVFDGSPCANAGILEGDVIVAVNGRAVRSSREVFTNMGLKIHEPVVFTVKRSVALDMDWDGRSRKWETQTVDIPVTPQEFDVEIHPEE